MSHSHLSVLQEKTCQFKVKRYGLSNEITNRCVLSCLNIKIMSFYEKMLP